jgi:L-aminopeptidase/D-esterase-like protein
MGDGDVFFALATGASDVPANMNRLGAAAALAMARAIVSAVRHASGLGGVPSSHEVLGNGRAHV